MPAPVFSCPHTEHQFDIREPVRFVFILYIPSDGVILRHSCVLYSLTVGKAENSPRAPCEVMTTWERPERADKNGASLVPPPISPCVPPPPSSRSRHTTPHDTASPNRPPLRIAYRHATLPAPRQPRTAPPPRPNDQTPNTPPSDTHNKTNTQIATAATRQDETARENELTKTAQQDNADTKRTTTRDDDTRRKAKRKAKRQRRPDKRNADTRTPIQKTQAGRQRETRDETRSRTPATGQEDETPSPRPPDTKNEKKRHAMPSPPYPRHTAIIA